MSNNRSVKWCDDPIPGKHNADYKKVIYKRDINAYQCIVCGRIYEKNTIKHRQYISQLTSFDTRKIIRNL